MIEKSHIVKFQATMAIVGMPANEASAKALLILADLTLKGKDPKVSEVLQIVDDINDEYAAPTALQPKKQ